MTPHIMRHTFASSWRAVECRSTRLPNGSGTMSGLCNATMQSSFLMTVKLSGRFPIFSRLFQSLLALDANPLPASNAIIVVE